MTPLERAARAAALRYGLTVSEWEALPDVNPVANGEWDKREFREMARAAVEAIREPSEEMIVAVDYLEPREGWWPDEPGALNTPAQIWQAMIDAALKEG